MRVLSLLFCLTFLGGCGGYYILTVPDQLAPTGAEATVVTRLQRNDFFVLSLAVRDALMRLSMTDGEERGAHTDKLGYAATTVQVPKAPGLYRLCVSHQDLEGEEITAEAPVYVWDPESPVVAVDLDSLPGKTGSGAQLVRSGLTQLSQRAKLLYLTRRSVRRHRDAHEMLRAAGYPDGPVLLWRRQRWHIVRSGRFKVPRVIVESRLVSQLTQLRKVFQSLDVGVCNSRLAAKAFAEAGLRCVIVGNAPTDVGNVTRLKSWSELGQIGL